MKNEKLMNDKQNFKKQRIKMFFLEACKQIIISEGVENVSVRKVADIAGYSYATIYNYFTDLNEMLWNVKAVIIKDLVEIMQNKIHQPICDSEGIKMLFRIYIEYYLENPNVYKFFYFYKLNKPLRESEGTESEPNFELMWKETFKEFVLNGTLTEMDIEVVAKIFIYSIQGMLTLYFSNNGYLTKENIYTDLNNMVNYLL